MLTLPQGNKRVMDGRWWILIRHDEWLQVQYTSKQPWTEANKMKPNETNLTLKKEATNLKYLKTITTKFHKTELKT